VTGHCIVLLAACAALLAAGLSTGAPLYYALSAAAGAIIVASLFSAACALLSLRVQAQLPRLHAQRGENVSLRLKIRHAGFLPVAALELTLISAGGAEVYDVEGGPFRWHAQSFDIPCPHRGVYSAGVQSAAAADVFGLFSLRRKITDCMFTVEVAPRAYRTEAMELGAGETGPEAPNRSAEDDSSPSGIREWKDGDELKKIHWKLSMRRREPVVRTYEESAKPDFLILMDLSPIGALRSQEMAIEDAVCEAAASAAMAHLSAGYPVRMPMSGSRPIECSGRSEQDLPRFIDALTTVQFDCAYPFEQLLAVEMRRMQRTGGAALITPRLTARTADFAMQMRRSGLRVRLNWITESRGGDANEIVARLSLSGVEVVRINPYAAAR